MNLLVRFRHKGIVYHGLQNDGQVFPLTGGIFAGPVPDDFFSRVETKEGHPLADVELLCPCEPRVVLCVGLNYRSHLHGRKEPEHPELFLKPLSALVPHGADIVIPPDATDVHYEGELVIVIGKRVSKATREEAAAAIFGVTCGNDVSERQWQKGPTKDLQWWRAKGSDTFGPLGPAIAVGLDYTNLLLTTRVNGEIRQQQRISDLIFDLPEIVRWASQWVTLNPGDVIYTGTPGETTALKPGDVVEVELEGVGTLRNGVR